MVINGRLNYWIKEKMSAFLFKNPRFVKTAVKPEDYPSLRSLPEIAGTGYYTVDDGDMATGDVGVVKEGTRVIGWGIHRPEVDDSLIISEVDANEVLLDSILEDTGTTLPATLESLNTLIALDSTVLAVTEADISFTLVSGSTDDNAYNNMVISIKQQVGDDVRERRVTDYIGVSRTVTVDYDFEFPITAGDIARIYLGAYSTTAGAAAVSEIAVASADAVWDEAEADHVTTGTFGKKLHDWRGLER